MDRGPIYLPILILRRHFVSRLAGVGDFQGVGSKSGNDLTLKQARSGVCRRPICESEIYGRFSDTTPSDGGKIAKFPFPVFVNLRSIRYIIGITLAAPLLRLRSDVHQGRVFCCAAPALRREGRA
jgi:hypothetical protein